MVDAVVLAGGNAKGLAAVPAKGLVPIGNRPMLEYVVTALHDCAEVDRVCIVMPVAYDTARLGDKVGSTISNGSLPQSAKAGIDYLSTDKPVLILSADIPLITSEAVSDFLSRCSERKAEVYYPIVRYGESEKRFPDVKRTYVRLREGRFTGGNIALIAPAVITRNMAFMEHIFELRKSPLKLFQLLGFGFLLRFVLGLLNIGQVEQRTSRLFQASCAAVITPYIEIGVDVDKESDLELAIEALSGGGNE